MARTWKAPTAGILAIIAGCLGLLTGIGLALGLGLVGSMVDLIPGFPGGLLALIGVPGIILGILAIVGGIFALRRRHWGLALAGCICALFAFSLIPPLTNVVLAIIAIVIVILGKGEFE